MIGGGCQHARLRAGVPLPGQELLEGEALPDEDPTPELLVGPGGHGWKMAIDAMDAMVIW